jgi:hypothetical protein
MKQYATPVSIINETATVYERVSLSSRGYNEAWIQDICFINPTILPVEELEPTFGGMIPICREMATESGPVDLVYVNELGYITLAECKLWRNPEARRKVIGQILDYAKDLAKWDFTKFEAECLKARRRRETSLFEIIQAYYPDCDEASFCDNVQSNLSKGRFLLSIIGDGIRENTEELANYIHRNGNLNFTLALIELPLFQKPGTDEIIITPRILAKTKEIERLIYRVVDQNAIVSETTAKNQETSNTISERVFFEKLAKTIGQDKSNELQAFIANLTDDLAIRPKLGRGKQLSLNIKSANEGYNFASIQDNGEVWFYGIVYKSESLGDRNIGFTYLSKLAELVKGEVDRKYDMWMWCVKRNGKYISIIDYLENKTEWKAIISDTLDALSKLEEGV